MRSNTFECQSCKGQYQDISRDSVPYFHACAPLPPDDNGVQVERPNKRDENFSTNQRGSVTGIIAAGAGVKCLTDARVTEPAWLAAINRKLAAQEAAENAVAAA